MFGLSTPLDASDVFVYRPADHPYIEQTLRPALRPGPMVVMDNLSLHKGERVHELIEERGCKLLYLPPYSPDLDPIEEAFSKVKGLLRKAEVRTRQALVERIGSLASAWAESLGLLPKLLDRVFQQRLALEDRGKVNLS